MSEVNYRRNGMKYSTTGKCWGMASTLLRQGLRLHGVSASRVGGQEAGGGLIEAALPDATKKCERPKSSRERQAGKKGK